MATAIGNKTATVLMKDGSRRKCRLSGVRILADGRWVGLAKPRNSSAVAVEYVGDMWPNWRELGPEWDRTTVPGGTVPE